MSDEKTTYYAITGGGKTVDDPRGIVRRRTSAKIGIIDEALQRDLEWHRTGIIAEWELGNFARELEEVSKDRALQMIEGFRADGPY
jgi:hypothetical protein